MSDSQQGLGERLNEEGARVIDFFNSLSPNQWEKYVYAGDENWTFHDLLAHFVSAEIGRCKLIIDVAGGGKGAPFNFDIDEFNHNEVDQLSVENNKDLLKLFSKERTNLIKFIITMKPEDLDRIGNDPFLGKVSLRDMIKLTYRHLQIHLRDARRCL